MKKTTNSKKESVKHNPDINMLIEKKMIYFQEVIQRTILHVQKNKMLEIIGVSEQNMCLNSLVELNKKILDIKIDSSITDADNIISVLQSVNNELSTLFRIFGTDSFEDMLWICFGNNSVNTYAISDMDKSKFELLKKYFHPTSYKLLTIKTDENSNAKNKNVSATLNYKSKNLDTTDVDGSVKQFHLKVFGIQIIVHNPQHKKSLIITGIVDDIMIDIINNNYLNLKTKSIHDNMPNSQEFHGDAFNRYISTMSLKDYLLMETHEFYTKYAGYLSNLNALKHKPVGQIVKEFVNYDLFMKRNTIIQLLIKNDKFDNQYLAYLLYDLLSNDSNGNIDTKEQTTIFDSFPWIIKQSFKDAMKNTIQYTNDLSNFDINKIPLEQQICLLQVNDVVKEKAMQKFKEIKAKSEDSGSKARQYLDGLLKIPFNIYRREPILNVMNDIKMKFVSMLQKHNMTDQIKEQYTSIEILKIMKQMKTDITNTVSNNDIFHIEKLLEKYSNDELKQLTKNINEILITNKHEKLKLTAKNMKERRIQIIHLISQLKHKSSDIYKLICDLINHEIMEVSKPNDNITDDLSVIENKYGEINNYMNNVKSTLDNAIHGHDKAKKQIERIIGQWINGKQDGYCFGFEGPPGTGKTTMAKKGLADCLKDENGVPRPFAMIQMGGDANGSSLHGHNYTYVGSTWGSIVQILIDKKCMNPIIFIDEVDKISKTEHGKEIVGILTHLLDPAQNDCFQDKYFSGIDLDLSKALFILSYNDVEAIDKIMLDRIHRVKFNGLTLDEKIVVSNKHILPDIYSKMGLKDVIHFSDDVLKHIIDEYTLEPGVRKLKEILFEIVGEINLDILKNFDTNYDIPIEITVNDIKTKYFKDKHEIKYKKIHEQNKVGIINGLWANAYGKGGIIPIQASWRPSDKFMHLHLTGMQGDVMKESMNVALTLAWKLTTNDEKMLVKDEHMNTLDGIHIHCPEGATPKDGPSAGTAITTTIYSLLTKKRIKCNIAITGEITLDGKVTEIGGLDLKFLGGIKAGVTEFIYPKENQKDYDNFMEKYGSDELTNGIKFTAVETIDEVFEIVFE